MKKILIFFAISLIYTQLIIAKPLQNIPLKSSKKINKKIVKKMVYATTKVDLMIKNGHLNKVVIGWSNKASDGYDQSLDFLAPPSPGMGTGFSALLLDDKKMMKYHFYQIIHNKSIKMNWTLLLKVNDKKKITISWTKTQLSKDYSFSIQMKKKTISMTKVSSITISESETIKIIATKIKSP